MRKKSNQVPVLKPNCLPFKIRHLLAFLYRKFLPVSFPSAPRGKRTGEKKVQGTETILRPLVHFSAALMSPVILSIFLLLPSPVAAAGKSFEKRRGLKGAASSWEGGSNRRRLHSRLRQLSIFPSLFSKCDFRALQTNL